MSICAEVESDADTQPLLQPLRMGDVQLRNRVVMAPMTRSRANNAALAPTRLHREYYRQRASADLIVSEGTWVSPDAIGAVNVPGIYSDEQVDAWAGVTTAVHSVGGVMFVQIGHTGAYSHPEYRAGRTPGGPSAVSVGGRIFTRGGFVDMPTPRALATSEIDRIIEDYRAAAVNARRANPDAEVPWTGFDLINTFNAWKKTEDAGRVFSVDTAGSAEPVVTGLAWRTQVCQQVFEEAAVDCGKGLTAWSESRSGKRKGKRVGFPKFKKKTGVVPSFRLRSKHPKGGKPAIRVGDGDRPRSVTLPGIGVIAVHDDTRRLRRMLAKDRAKILFATITHRAGRWWVSLNVDATELHPNHQHHPNKDAGWVGIDRGLSAFLVAATGDGTEVARIIDAPKALAAGMAAQRRLAKSLSRKKEGSRNRRDAAATLGRHHHRVDAVRRHFCHQVSNALVKTHDRIVIEDLHVAGMLANHRLARAISDAGWAEFARQLHYKQVWRGGKVTVADRWYPSSQLCSICGDRRTDLSLADRVFVCANGHRLDRDTNAAANLARWGQTHHNSHRSPDPQVGGRATNARRQDGSDQHPSCAGETSLDEAGTNVHTAPAA